MQGNGTTHQIPVLGVYPQGTLQTFPGSKIQLALTAVRLFGPDYEDTGGIIKADGTKFLNNRCGIYFAPFNNYLVDPGKPRNYLSYVRNCTFDIVDGLPLPVPFIYHINMYKVNGIFITGSTFANSQHIDDATDPRAYGIGIKAVDAGFIVEASTTASKFRGLGIAISVNKVGVNRPFQVSQSEFSQCYFGIVNDGVSGGLVVNNEFEMGAVQTLDGGHEDQVGISFSGLLAGLTIQQNHFELTDEITDNSLGIVMNGIGEMDHIIRKNYFDGITIGNEAFGINGINNVDIHQGLRYLCNENTDVQMNDFYLPNDVTIEDYINNVQGQPVIDNVISAGNIFSETGDNDDGDFGNYGDNDIEKYFYNTNVSLEEPIDFVGINTLVLAAENLCSSNFCLDPCLDGTGFTDEVDDFYSNQVALKFATYEDDYDLVAFYHLQSDANIFNILRYIEYDTATFKRDTLRAWYYRAGSIAGDLLLAADFFDTGEYTDMNNTLDDIPTRHVLTSLQELDIDRVKFTYGALSARTVYGLTSTDIDSLVKFSEGVGAAASLSRSTLAILDTLRTPRYYIPGEIDPRSDARLSNAQKVYHKIKIYPNPIMSQLTVEVPEINGKNVKMELLDVTGNLLKNIELKVGRNELNITEIHQQYHGVILYRIFSDKEEIDFGKLINIK